MKAISPALPMTAPCRQSNGADASAADEAFSALIAAVIGAPATPSAPTPSPAAPSASSRSTTRVDKPDDARPAAATSRSARTANEAADATTDQSGSATSSDPTKSSDATQPATTGNAASQPKPGSAPSAPAPTTPSASSATNQPKLPAGVEKAAAALAQALAAAPGDTMKTTPVKGIIASVGTQALPVGKPGTALTEGQLPAQLVAAVAGSQPPVSPSPVIGTPNGKLGDKPAGKVAKADDKQPTQSTPVGTPPKADGLPVVAPPPASTQAPHPGQPQVSSEATASPTVGSAVTSTTDHHKPAEPKPVAQDQHPQGAATAAHFDAQLSAQAPAPTTQLPTVSPIQQSQPVYSSGMVSQQIVQVVAPLRAANDGDYTLSLQLHPADLGAVTVRVEVQQGVLSVHMSAEHAHGHEALNQSLADLRTQLQNSGVRTGDIVVAAKPSAMPQHQQQQQHTGARHQQEASMYDDGADRRPSDQPSRQAQQQADDDALDVRI